MRLGPEESGRGGCIWSRKVNFGFERQFGMNRERVERERLMHEKSGRGGCIWIRKVNFGCERKFGLDREIEDVEEKERSTPGTGK